MYMCSFGCTCIPVYEGHRPMRKIHVEWLKKKLHTCILPCNTTLVWHVDKMSTKYTHIIMDTFMYYVEPGAQEQRDVPTG